MTVTLRRVPTYVTIVCVLAIGMLSLGDWTVTAASSEFWNAFGVLLALALVAEGFSTQLLRSTATMAVSFVPYIATMILLGGPWAMVIAGIAELIAETIIRRKELIKVAHNTAKEIVALGVAGTLYAAFGGVPALAEFRLNVPGFAVAVGFYFILSNGATATAIALSTGSTLRETFGRIVGKSFVYDFLASSLSVLLAFLYSELAILGLFLVIVPLFFVRHTNHMNVQLEETNRDLLELMVKAIEARDTYTCGHSQRVSKLASALAREIGLGFREVENITSAALLHDVGKIYEEFAPILRKAGAMTDGERVLMESHPARSSELVRTISALRGTIEQCVRHHHEAYDGSGYPDGLVGETIPLGSRIVAIADTADAMTTDRPYRRALTFDALLAELDAYSGRQFDPQLVQAFQRSSAIRSMFAESRPVVRSMAKSGTEGWRLRIAK